MRRLQDLKLAQLMSSFSEILSFSPADSMDVGRWYSVESVQGNPQLILLNTFLSLLQGTVETWIVFSFVAPSEITSFSSDLKPFFST